MRYSLDKKYPWPKNYPSFAEASLEYYKEMMSLARICLAGLAEGIETAPENLTDKMLDKEQMGEGYSSSIYRFFRYFMRVDAMEEPCQVHTDIGMMTMIPLSSAPALQLLHSKEFAWIDIEKYGQERDVVIFCGETLERITAYYFRAVIHRVARTGGRERYSEVFLLRARPDSWIDSEGLNTKVIGKLYYDLKNKMSIAEYMRMQYANKKSANFVNKKGKPVINMISSSETGQQKEEEQKEDIPYEEKVILIGVNNAQRQEEDGLKKEEKDESDK